VAASAALSVGSCEYRGPVGFRTVRRDYEGRFGVVEATLATDAFGVTGGGFFGMPNTRFASPWAGGFLGVSAGACAGLSVVMFENVYTGV
jgi:hypothetical protein